MKNVFDKEGAKRLHDAIISDVKENCDNGQENYILLSGGIDSMCVLYTVMELDLPYKVVNFAFRGWSSRDRDSIKKLHEKVDFDAIWPELEPEDMNTLYESVKMCQKIFGRIRKVKVETIYAMLQVRKFIPEGVNILSGFGGDGAVCYHRKDGILIAQKGEESEEVLTVRRGNKKNDEFRYIFDKWNYYTPYHNKAVTDVICDYTVRSCNAKFPKSAFVYAFEEYFQKYKNVRKPEPFHKSAGEPEMFTDWAKKNGFDSDLKWFNHIGKELKL